MVVGPEHGAVAIARAAIAVNSGGVEMWRGGVGWAYPSACLPVGRPTLSVAGVSLAIPCSVSTSRSSNLPAACLPVGRAGRTCGSPASGFRTRIHAFAHGKRVVSKDNSANPNVL